MSHLTGRLTFSSLLIIVAFLLLGCSSSEPAIPTPAPTLPPITLYDGLPTATLSPTPDLRATDTPQPTLTPTPVSYQIIAGDTLVGIAERNGITLDELLAANPGVSAQFLSIGQEILIPLGGSSVVTVTEDDTLIPLVEGAPHCFGTAAGELWCFFPVTNNSETPIESPVADIQLLAASGEVVDEAQAFGLIEKLDSGDSMPLVAYWQSAPEAWSSISASLVSSFRLDDPAARYVPAQADLARTTIAASGLSALVSGEIIAEDFGQIARLWVLAVAYDESGQVAGVRRIQLEDGENEFSFEVYSLGPAIDTVEVLTEARR